MPHSRWFTGMAAALVSAVAVASLGIAQPSQDATRFGFHSSRWRSVGGVSDPLPSAPAPTPKKVRVEEHVERSAPPATRIVIQMRPDARPAAEPESRPLSDPPGKATRPELAPRLPEPPMARNEEPTPEPRMERPAAHESPLPEPPPPERPVESPPPIVPASRPPMNPDPKLLEPISESSAAPIPEPELVLAPPRSEPVAAMPPPAALKPPPDTLEVIAPEPIAASPRMRERLSADRAIVPAAARQPEKTTRYLVTRRPEEPAEPTAPEPRTVTAPLAATRPASATAEPNRPRTVYQIMTPGQDSTQAGNVDPFKPKGSDAPKMVDPFQPRPTNAEYVDPFKPQDRPALNRRDLQPFGVPVPAAPPATPPKSRSGLFSRPAPY